MRKQPSVTSGQRYIAKRYAKTRGDVGSTGGWIYDRNGYPICHGWGQYYCDNKNDIVRWGMTVTGIYEPKSVNDLIIALRGLRIGAAPSDGRNLRR